MLQLFPSPAAGPFGRRLKRARGGRVPVTAVTGFLGAGKTTLIRNFLSAPEGAGTAVIVNEFGEIGIDDALLRASAEATVLIGNGCLCCNMRSDLQLALARLFAERERGLIPQLNRILIETSGLADPAPILSTFATDRALGREFHLEAVVAVVDAATGAATLEWSAEARKQVIFADRLVLTKTDLAGRMPVEQLTERLRALNPRAEIDVAIHGHLDPRRLLDAGEGRAAIFLAEAAHSDGIASFVLTESAPLEWRPFALAMEALVALRGPDLLRVKGWLHVAGCRGPVLVQFVQHLAHPPVELAAWPGQDRASRLVVITRNLPEHRVRELIAAVRALGMEKD